MSFKASTVIPQEAYRITKGAAVQLKANLQGFNTSLAAADADYEILRGIYRTLERAKDQLNSLKTTPGLASWAKDQEDDQSYDVVAEFNGLLSAIGDAMTWMDSNVPTTGRTAKTFAEAGDGTLIANMFTPAQTAGLRSELNAVIATIS